MAVYTKVSDDEASDFLRAYDIGAFRELVGIKQGVENTNYHLFTDQGRYILTLYEKRVKEEDLPFFLGLMEHLVEKNVPCSLPIKNREGQTLSRIAGRPAAISKHLDGAPAPRITPENCSEVGRAMAAFHCAGLDFGMYRENALALPAWSNILALCAPRASEVMAGLADLLQEELKFLEDQWPHHLPRGIIHADLFHDNVLFDGDEISGIIDFYFSCDDLWAYDLAIGLNAWCFEPSGAFNITKARGLIKGYGKGRPLSSAELNALPLLARGAALRFLLTRLFDWLNQVPEALVKAKDPLDYLTRLQFHQMVDDIAAYGLGS